MDVIAEGKTLPSFKELTSMIITFSFTSLAWIFFRAENIEHAFSCVSKIFSATLFDQIQNFDLKTVKVLGLIMLLIIIEWIGRNNSHALEGLKQKNKSTRWLVYITLVITIIVFKGNNQDFIYFQF